MSGDRAAGFGAFVREGGVLFRVWTQTPHVELVLVSAAGGADRTQRLNEFTLCGDGVREIFVPGVGAGTRYGYTLDGAGPYPDPASRFQPEGVHALSEVIDPAFEWTDADFRPVPWRKTVIYELHCSAFTPEGTFRAAQERLPELSRMGITTVELMPVAAFPGSRNWGYDGVSLFAPSANYGRPEEMRRFVNHAHALGLSVYLDVVYNHLGPDGAYHRLFHPGFYRHDVATPWGDSLNFHGEYSKTAREFFIANALHWLTEYHIDGFRLDATHAIYDEGPTHFLAELSERLHGAASAMGREVMVIAEDERNLSKLLRPRAEGGYELDAVWADDFHHQVRRALAGDSAGYYADYDGDPAKIATTLRNGWLYEGQYSRHRDAPRGTPSGDLHRSRFIICIQNHDQIGNRAHGERLHHQVPDAPYRAASALFLLAPETPLLFMGQEWAASSPFLYFTDHNETLGPLVTEGRLKEFARFPEFAAEGASGRIPNPQAEATFQSSKLNWDERVHPRHAAMLRWYKRLLQLRRQIVHDGASWTIREESGIIGIRWQTTERSAIAICALLGAGRYTLESRNARLLFSSEDPAFCSDSAPPVLDSENGTVIFHRAGCCVLTIDGRDVAA